MVDQVALVPFTTADLSGSGGSGTLDITSPLITEAFKTAIFFYSGAITDDADNTHAIGGAGYCSTNADGAALQNASIGMQAENGVTAVDAGFRNLNGKCINVPLGTDVLTEMVAASFNSAIAGGVKLNVTALGANRVKGIALLFAGITESVIRQIQPTTTTAQVDCPDSGGGAGTFEPDFLVWLTHDHPGGAINEAEGQWSLGFTLNPHTGGLPQQIASFFNIDEIDPTDADGVARTDVSFGWLNLGTRAQETGGVVAFNASGFTAASSIVGGIRCSFLGIKFSGPYRAAIGQLAVSSGAGVKPFNAFGFTPEVVLGLSTLLAATDTPTDGPTASCGGYFMASASEARANTWRQAEGVDLNPATTAATSRQEAVAVLQYDHSGTVVTRGTWAGPTGNGGFAINFSAAAAGFLTALGLQLHRAAPAGASERAPPGRGERGGAARALAAFGKHRASSAFMRLVRFWEVQRRSLFDRLHYRRKASEVPPTPIPETFAGPPQGDNAQAGSERGSNAGAGSEQGWTG